MDKREEDLPGWEPGSIEYMVEHGLADLAFWKLKEAESAEEHRSICASIILASYRRGSYHLNEGQHAALAEAVRAGFPKRFANRPPLEKRNREIQALLMLSPPAGMNGSQLMPATLFEALDPALHSARYTEADVIERLMDSYGLNKGAAKAAFNKARADLEAQGYPAYLVWPKSL